MAASDVLTRPSLLEEESSSEIPAHPPVIKAGLLRARRGPSSLERHAFPRCGLAWHTLGKGASRPTSHWGEHWCITSPSKIPHKLKLLGAESIIRKIVVKISDTVKNALQEGPLQSACHVQAALHTQFPLALPHVYIHMHVYKLGLFSCSKYCYDKT